MTIDNPIIQGVEALHGDAVVELRGLKGRNKTASGYYTDRHKLASDARLLEKKGYTLYCTLQDINPALLARYTNRFEENPVATTTDGDVLNYIWLLIDLDPVRPAYVSSTDEEKAAARKRVEEIRAHLRGLEDGPKGFSRTAATVFTCSIRSPYPSTRRTGSS